MMLKRLKTPGIDRRDDTSVGIGSKIVAHIIEAFSQRKIEPILIFSILSPNGRC